MPQAINPYNFVPFYGDSFNEAPARKPLADYYSESRPLKSGWIDVTLYTKSEVIVPESDPFEQIPQKDEFGKPIKDKKGNQVYHNKYHFFRHPDDTYAIPGSELRGMLRSMYEAASNSCFPFLLKDPEHPISQRTPIYAAFKDRGLLEYSSKDNRWRLYRAITYRKKTVANKVKTGTFLCDDGIERKTGEYIDYSVNKTPDGETQVFLGKGNRKGYLQFNIPVVKTKKNKKTGKYEDVPYNVVVLERGEPEYEWPSGKNPQDCDAYRSAYGSIYDTVNNAKPGQSTLGDLKAILKGIVAEKKDGTIPVYYFRVERDGKPIYYLSGAAAGRVQQKRKWPDIMGAHSPCYSLDLLCPACALFGTTSGKGVKGRLRITDARAENEPVVKTHTLPILGEPRSSSFEFYLRKPTDTNGGEVTYWNYDYYGINSTGGKVGTDYCNLPKATPRGRKFYWHGQRKQDVKPNKLNATMDAVQEGATFQFRLYFDRITEPQLHDLLWVISLGENNAESTRWHKVGHAKPLGYGSVKLVATDCVIREVGEDYSIHLRPLSIPTKPECSFPMDSKTIRSIIRIVDQESVQGEDVSYLTGMTIIRGEGKPMIYAWFSENRKNANSVMTLPEPWESNLTLPTQRGARAPLPNKNTLGGKPAAGALPKREYHASSSDKVGTVGKNVKATVKSVWPSKNGVDVSLEGYAEKGVFFRRDNDKYFVGQNITVEVLDYIEKYKNYKVRPIK